MLIEFGRNYETSGYRPVLFLRGTNIRSGNDYTTVNHTLLEPS